jgi:hypothetical protein
MMALYELQVFDDGECAVRKISKRTHFAFNTFFSTQEDLKEYLLSVIAPRCTIDEVLTKIDTAQEYEWTEFK